MYSLQIRKFASLESLWKSMETPQMSPFLHYDYMKFVRQSVALFKPFFARVFCVCTKETGEVLMICPMKIRADFKYYTLLGDMQGCDIADMVWKKDLSEGEKRNIADFFFGEMTSKMYLNRVPADSVFAAAVPMDRVSYTRDVGYVSIAMENSFEEYLQRLSKNMRHQINKTYNRLEREGVEFDFHIYENGNLPSKDLEKKINRMYVDRLISRYNPEREGSSFWKLYYRTVFQYLKHDTRSFRKLPNSFMAVVMSGSEVMAFVSGFKTHDEKTVAMTRLAINDEFDRYSPGRILMKELIEYLHKNTSIKTLDMSRGDERYKFDFGGELYYIKDFVVEKS